MQEFNEVAKIADMVESTEIAAKLFREAEFDGKPFFRKNERDNSAFNLWSEKQLVSLTQDTRPEVFAAYNGCVAIIQAALDAEHERWAKALEDFHTVKQDQK